MWRTLSFIVAVGGLARAAAWSTVEIFQLASPPQKLQGTRVHSGPFGYMSLSGSADRALQSDRPDAAEDAQFGGLGS